MNFTSYALSVFAVIVISAIADMMLPQGKIKKTAKAVFSLIITFTLLSPAIRLIKGDINVDEIVVCDMNVDEDFITYTLDIAKKSYEINVFELLKTRGYDNVTEVDCEVDESGKKVKNVKIIYDKNGINGKDEHTYISEVKTIVASALNISEEVVSVSGG